MPDRRERAGDVVVTERLRLRLPVAADAAAAGEMLSDPEVMRFLGGEIVQPDDVPAVIAKWCRRWHDNGVGPFVVERHDGRFVGRTGLLVWDTRTWAPTTFVEAGEHAQAELGWAFARSQWGNGYATEAARGVRDWAREHRGIEHLISLIAPANAASRRVAQRLGATRSASVTLYDSGVADVWVHPQATD